MKKIIAIVLLATTILTLAGCNAQIIDTTLAFDKAIIRLPDGTVVEGKVTSWSDFEDGDQIQIKMNGKTYLTHISNAVLIREHKGE